jgi:phosphoesterase RecJ-like protein
VYENVYQSDSLNYLRLSGEVLCSSVYEADLGLIYGYVSQADLESFGVRMNETEDLIDNLRTLRGHHIVALFKEQPDGRVRVSLRSRSDVDIGTLARSFGGGGHRVAAGYTSSRNGFGEALDELKD